VETDDAHDGDGLGDGASLVHGDVGGGANVG
jgi:hypothetical protein